MADESRPYSERPAARPDPDLVKAQQAADAAKPQGGGCMTGCLFIIVAAGALAIIGIIISTIVNVLTPG